MDAMHTDQDIMINSYIQERFFMFISLKISRIVGKKNSNKKKCNCFKNYAKGALIINTLLTLNGCDVMYHSSEVQDDGTSKIRVVKITPETIIEANSSPYEPLKLPEIFSAINESDDQFKDFSALSGQALKSEKYFDVIYNGFPEPSQPQPYFIGVGDVIMMIMPEVTNLVDALDGLLASQNRQHRYTVQDDGAVSIPDIGRIVIAGLTLQEAEDAVFRQLVDKGLTASFSMEVAEYNSQRVSVVGAVVSPGIEPIALQPLYLDEIISLRGGFTISDTSFILIYLYRDGSIYKLTDAELYNQDSLFKFLLKNGDRVVVKTTEEYDNLLGLRQTARHNIILENELNMEARANASKSVQLKLQYGAIPREYIYIIGEVGSQTRFTLPFEDKAVLADALLTSGGVLPMSGNPKQIYLLRGSFDNRDTTSITAMHLDATNAANFLLATRLELRPKDVVFVGTQPITNWNRMIKQILPSLQLSNK